MVAVAAVTDDVRRRRTSSGNSNGKMEWRGVGGRPIRISQARARAGLWEGAEGCSCYVGLPVFVVFGVLVTVLGL